MAIQGEKRAAQYLRMSTEHQRYSLHNQAAVIGEYAEARGYSVSRTYFDPGKSGLTLKERKGLQGLLADALRPDRDFDAILVLDVSRWGRFQDPDQAAHYEFLCREAGVSVIYCAEPFSPEDGLVATIVKSLKRVMAAEYSRELSEKIYRAHLAQAALGFHQGGSTLYGLRRLVLDRSGAPRAVLERGQHKGIADDRVVLVPGPESERAVIRRIFRRYVRGDRSFTDIARELNAEGVAAVEGRPWSVSMVRTILRSELMTGFYSYNRYSVRMKAPRSRNRPEQWVRVKVMEPIVSTALFRRAAQVMAQHASRLPPPEAELLDRVSRFVREGGDLTRRDIDRCSYLPAAKTLEKRFGGLRALASRIGYAPPPIRSRLEDGRIARADALLEGLKQIYAREHHISGALIDAEPGLPSRDMYKRFFGSITRAYELAGLPYQWNELRRAAYLRSVQRGTAPIVTGVLKRARPPKYTEAELLDHIRRLSARDRYISARRIAQEPGPSLTAYYKRFGVSVRRAPWLGWLTRGRLGDSFSAISGDGGDKGLGVTLTGYRRVGGLGWLCSARQTAALLEFPA